jgi:hypothetical protein
MIDHEINGYVAEYLSAKSLATGIQWTLSHAPSDAAREKVVASYQEEIIAAKHEALYLKYLTDGSQA